MSLSGLPFDDIRELAGNLPEADETSKILTVSRNEQLADVFGDLGRQPQITEWLASWSGKSPNVSRPMVAIFAGTHSIIDHFDEAGETTLDSVTRLAAGGAPVNQVCALNDIGLKVFDLALQYPVADISVEAALDEKAAAATIGFGMEAISGGVDVLALSAMGLGAELSAAAILQLVLGGDVGDWLGSQGNFNNKKSVELVQKASNQHKDAADNPLDLLRRLGGREFSAIAGAILAARTSHIPVVLDGVVAMSVAILLKRMVSSSCGHCMIAGSSDKEMISKLIAELDLPYVLQNPGVYNDCTAGALALAHVKNVAAIHNCEIGNQ